MESSKKPVYLDYNATTPIAPSVVERIRAVMESEFGNPSSTHALGRASHAVIEQARNEVAELLGSQRGEIIFTSGGTESSNLAIQGTAFRRDPSRGGHIIISAIEHPATVEPARWLTRFGFELSNIGCDRHGVIDPDGVAAAIRDDTILISIMHANNEVGAIQPIPAIAEICRRANVPFHVDAAQSLGKIIVDVNKLGVDLLTVAGHKFYAPKGVGALFIRDGIDLEPIVRGASHERGLRPGTENTPYIAGLGEAARLAQSLLPSVTDRMAALRDRLESGLRNRIPKLTVNAQNAERLPNTASVNFPNVVGAELLAATPELCASTGAACHSGATKVSATLTAMGVPESVARGTVRLSVGRATTETEIDIAVERLAAAWRAANSS